MDTHKLVVMLLFILSSCSPATVTPSIQTYPTETILTPPTPPAPSVTVTPSATLESDFPEGCVNLVVRQT